MLTHIPSFSKLLNASEFFRRKLDLYNCVKAYSFVLGGTGVTSWFTCLDKVTHSFSATPHSIPVLYLENGDKNTSVPGGFAGFGKGLKETMHVKSLAGVFYAVRAQYPVARSLLPTVFSVPVGD